MKCSIVVLHYKNIEDTKECIASLAKIDYPCFDIILVDNGSGDDFTFLNRALLKSAFEDDSQKEEPCAKALVCLEMRFQKSSNVVLVRNASNLGFAEGCNRGLARAVELQSTHILLLNNDTVVAPDILSAFMTAAHNYPEAAVFGAKILYYDEPTILWHAGGDVDWKKLRCFHEGCTVSDLEKKYEIVRPITYACGCALFVTATAYRQVGGFDPAYFLLWEEIDWCFRLKKAGYECLYVPQARLWHKISCSFEGGNRGALWQYYNFRNRLRFLQHHGTRAQRYRFYLKRFPKEILELLLRSFHPSQHQRRLHRAALKGICHYLLDLLRN